MSQALPRGAQLYVGSAILAGAAVLARGNNLRTRGHDVPYDLTRRRDRYQRGYYVTASSQQIHEPRLVVTTESTAVHLRDAGVVLGSLGRMRTER